MNIQSNKRTIWYLPIEYIETRYSAEWYEYIPEMLARYIKMVTGRDALRATARINGVECKKSKIKSDYAVVTVAGELIPCNNTEGAFLNFAATNYWKSSQLAALASCISQGAVKDNDIIYVTDAWNPAILQIRYMLDLLGIKAEIHAQWHAGYHDPEDQLYKRIQALRNKRSKEVMLHTEAALFNAINKNYFTTEFYHRMFRNSDSMDVTDYSSDDTVLCGYPLGYMHDLPYANSHQFFSESVEGVNGKSNPEGNYSVVKLTGNVTSSKVYDKIAWYDRSKGLAYKSLVLFPHRNAEEKMPEVFEAIRDMDVASKLDIQSQCVSVHDFGRPLTKEEYYNLLSASRVVVSFAKQETYGISMVEAVMAGAIPIVPSALSYAEMYLGAFMYNSDLLDRPNETKIEQIYSVIYNLYEEALSEVAQKQLAAQKEKLVNEFFGDLGICKSLVGR